jgi:hypothetical protein
VLGATKKKAGSPLRRSDDAIRSSSAAGFSTLLASVGATGADRAGPLWRALAAAAAALLLGEALCDRAAALASLSLAVLLLGLSLLPEGLLPALRARALQAALLALLLFGLGLALAALLLRDPSWSMKQADPRFGPLALGVLLAALLVLLALPRLPSRLDQLRLGLLLAVHLALGVWALRWVPQPWIDTFLFHTGGLRALLAGRSPYGGSIRNLYGAMPFYGPGLLTDDLSRVRIGYPYPPLALLLALPLQLVTGEARLLFAAALTGAGALLALARLGRTGLLASGLLLLSPRLFVLLEGSWTEPLVLLCLSLLFWSARRAPRLVPWALGGLLASKQYAVLLLPLCWLLLPPEGRSARGLLRLLLPALLLAAATCLPFLVASPRGFIDDVLLFQLRQPFRADALSWPALLGTGPWWSGWPLLLAAAGEALVLLAAPRVRLLPPALFALGSALCLTLFFASAKQAFENYYAVPLCACWWAVALCAGSPPPDPRGAT